MEMTPAITPASKIKVPSPKTVLIGAIFLKMPLPIMELITSKTAVVRPRARLSVGLSSMICNATLQNITRKFLPPLLAGYYLCAKF
jgi:hypothetical protein